MIELNKIYNEDCLIGMQRIPDKSVDAIICDLPYGTTANKWDVIIPFDKLWAQYNRVIKKDGVICLFAQPPFNIAVGASNLDMLKYEWIWIKEAGTGFLNAKNAPLKIHENILIFYKARGIYNPQGLRKLPKPIKVQRSGNNGTNYHKFGGKYVVEYTNWPNDVLYYPRDADGFHPTQKPVALIGYLIKTYTNEGGGGSGQLYGQRNHCNSSYKDKAQFLWF